VGYKGVGYRRVVGEMGRGVVGEIDRGVVGGE